MKINPIHLYNNIRPILKKQPTFHNPKEDIFERSKISFKGVPFGVNDDIKKIPDLFFNAYIKKIDSDTKEAAKESVFVAKMTKNMLDEKYGKNNYAVVSIGTSPAGVCKALELMGQDVCYVPITDVNYHPDWYVDFALNKNEQPEYVKFLKSIGLGLKNIEQDKRYYVFLDYTKTGKTLSRLEKAAEKAGADKTKCHFISLNNELDNYFEKHNLKKQQKRTDDYITKYCYLAHIDETCGIPHCFITGLEDINNIINYSKTQKETDFEYALAYYLKNGEKNEN